MGIHTMNKSGRPIAQELNLTRGSVELLRNSFDILSWMIPSLLYSQMTSLLVCFVAGLNVLTVAPMPHFSLNKINKLQGWSSFQKPISGTRWAVAVCGPVLWHDNRWQSPWNKRQYRQGISEELYLRFNFWNPIKATNH
ncbi:hypothetical protein BDV34DRAFT_198241 [Aspergillus parasiticus]|uniref:Uncharacterized protein n=1 Tax=Aspergillus parasiticus TaxID=5067 RepID=A0A5N6DFS5_ASPPA|nr:hypothetical protein BDV34DRAFT_198241 [Aspergillus parasiticus]